MSRSHLKGLGVSPGIAIGEPLVQETRPVSAMRVPVAADRIDGEVARFRRAVTTTVERIRENQAEAARQMGDEFAAIFEAHQLIASDTSFTQPVEQIYGSGGIAGSHMCYA